MTFTVKIFVFFLFMRMYMCKCTMWGPEEAWRSSLELEEQMAWVVHCGPWELNWCPLQEHQTLLTVVSSFQLCDSSCYTDLTFWILFFGCKQIFFLIWYILIRVSPPLLLQVLSHLSSHPDLDLHPDSTLKIMDTGLYLLSWLVNTVEWEILQDMKLFMH